MITSEMIQKVHDFAIELFDTIHREDLVFQLSVDWNKLANIDASNLMRLRVIITAINDAICELHRLDGK